MREEPRPPGPDIAQQIGYGDGMDDVGLAARTALTSQPMLTDNS